MAYEANLPNGTKLWVGRLPGRKRIGLCQQDGSVLYTMAYFRNETEAVRFLKSLDSSREYTFDEN